MRSIKRVIAGFVLFAVLLWASGIAPQAYQYVQANGGTKLQAVTLNLANSASVTWSCSVTSNVTSCTPTAAGGGSPSLVTWSGPSVIFLGTQYVPFGGGGAASGTETAVQVASPKPANIFNFFVNLSAALGIGNSAVFTVRDGANPEPITCTISGASATSCNDTTHNFNASQGDLLDYQAVTTGTPSAVTAMISITYTVIPPPASTPFITGQTLGTLRNNFTGSIGFQVNVGSANMVVTSLGRWIVSGNSGTHTVQILNSGGTPVASASINTTLGTPGTYEYVSIVPVTLLASTTYYVVSAEVSSGDQWYDNNTTVTTTGDATVPNACIGNVLAPPEGQFSYVPPNFQYHL